MKELADGKCDFAFSPDSPRKAVVSVEPKVDNASLYRLLLASDYAEEKLAEKFLKLVWSHRSGGVMP